MRTLLGLAAVTVICASCSSSQVAVPGAGGFTAYVAELGVSPSDPWKPIAGASAFVDSPNGARIEATSDATGRVVFPNVDFSAGPATVTAYAPGHVIQTAVGVTPELTAKLPLPHPNFPAAGKELVLPLAPSAEPENVVLSGKIKGKITASNAVTLTAVNGLGTFEDRTEAYKVQVPKGAPITLVALEWTGGPEGAGWKENKLRWMKLDVPAQNADATLDLDLAAGTPLTPTKVSVGMQAPATFEAPTSPIWLVVTERPFGRGVFLGSRNIVTADGKTFKAEGEYVASPDSADRPLTVAFFPGFDGATSVIQKAGLPAEGMTLTGLDYPTTPKRTALGADVVLGNVDPAADGFGVQIVKHSLPPEPDVLAWQIMTIPGARPTAITLPDLPDAARALLPPTASGRVFVREGSLDAERAFIPGRLSFSKFFPITK